MFYFYGYSILKSFLTVYLRRISAYSVASTSEAAFVIGGLDGSGSSTVDVIAKFENDEWSLLGNLRNGRPAHGSITYGTETLIIGGWTSDGK